MISLTLWMLFLIIGVCLILGQGSRAWVAAFIFLVIGMFLGGTEFGDFVRTMLSGVSGLIH